MLPDLIRPTDADSERVLVAHVLSLAARDKSVLASVPPAAFDNKIFSEVWRHARSLYDRGEKVTPRSVLTEAGHDKNEHLAGMLQGVTGQPVSAAQVGDSSRRVVEMYRMRQLLDGVSSAYERAQYAEDYSEALHHVTAALDGLEGTSTPKDVVTFADALDRWQERINDDTAVPRIFPTPWEGLNGVLAGGLHAGRSYVIGARPGEGKSMAGANLAQFAAEQGHSALIFSVEMDEHEVVSRALAAGSRANYGQITKRLIDAPNYAKIDAYAAQRRTMPLRIVDRADISVDFVRATCRTVKRQHGLDVVFVDYLQLLSPTDSQASRERQIAHISRSLKVLSRELDCAVVTACQLNRNTANEDRPPRKADLRESGSIEQDADVVILLHHIMHTAHDGKKEHSGEVDLIVDKNRTGPRDSINQMWAASQAAIR